MYIEDRGEKKRRRRKDARKNTHWKRTIENVQNKSDTSTQTTAAIILLLAPEVHAHDYNLA